MKKYFLFAIALLIFSSCGKNDAETTGESGDFEMGITNKNDLNEPKDEDLQGVLIENEIYERLLDSPATPLQLAPLKPGEELAVLHTNHGDITLRFFPEEAPRAVENYLTHMKNGLYDGLTFHRVIPDFMIQGGCPLGNGRGGESIFPEGLGLERSFNLHHFRGALAAAHAGPNTIGSQFYIVQNPELHDGYVDQFRYLQSAAEDVVGHFPDGRHIYVRDIHNSAALEHFIEHGGTPHLDWQWNAENYGHTVFGHVVSGMDVVDAIANVSANNTVPVEDVIIERVSFILHE
ncbi:MAG: peptidylprolyl isomerase [Defluviitaleaceae bacterium]|nr:peptidylprolyl isomerase [Defluviitaleaceae bacterium]